ncbi:MAG: sugar ABC transporter ATP-binding protein [Rectinema sp.]|jgi:ribose transport system ATP-binding protein
MYQDSMYQVGKMSDYIVEMKNISKSFPGVRALSNVNLSVKKGEVHALVGENGAGKSTLIKILTGAYQKDEGTIVFDGKEVDVKDPHFSKNIGIHAVYQDITLAMHLSVGENFFLGELPMSSPFTVDWKKVYSTANDVLASLDLKIDPHMLVRNLPVAKQEMVAIAKAIYEKSKLMIFDEPTALLTNEESEELFKIIARLKSEGIGIIYISHRLEEVFRFCDAVTILKDGRYVATMPTKDTNEDELISLMVGRKIEEMYYFEHHNEPEVVLSVRNLTKKKVFQGIHFDLHKGEILGMFGLVGSGRTDIVLSIFGATKYDEGSISFFGKPANVRKPREAIELGFGLVPENRRTQGLALPLSVKININLLQYKKISHFGIVIDRNRELSNAKSFIQELSIKTPSEDAIVRNLSGGNQQKVVIGKCLANQPKIMIFDEPTLGIDVGSKEEIYTLLEKLTKTGTSVIFISSYLPEVIGVSDRIVVISEGRQMGIIDRNEATEERIMKLASGIEENSAKIESEAV